MRCLFVNKCLLRFNKRQVVYKLHIPCVFLIITRTNLNEMSFGTAHVYNYGGVKSDHMDVLNRYYEYKTFWDKHRIPGEYNREILWEDPYYKEQQNIKRKSRRSTPTKKPPSATKKKEGDTKEKIKEDASVVKEDAVVVPIAKVTKVKQAKSNSRSSSSSSSSESDIE